LVILSEAKDLAGESAKILRYAQNDTVPILEHPPRCDRNMPIRDGSIAYESAVLFDANRIGAAAVYCSDGRFGEHFDDFLHNALELPRYDRLAVPGGAACLAGHFLAHREEEGLSEQLRFLITAHGIERVVLIAHQDCAFYTERLHVAAFRLETQQQEDLQAAVERLRSFDRRLTVDAYFARKQADGTIRFESLEEWLKG
jgi:hypothetical protein